jgi:hypothetical protein
MGTTGKKANSIPLPHGSGFLNELQTIKEEARLRGDYLNGRKGKRAVVLQSLNFSP